MSTFVYLSTQDAVVAAAEAKVSVFDRGFLFGDAVFETLRTVPGPRLVDGGPHLARLRRSAARVGIDVPWRDGELDAVLRRTCEATGADAHQVRVVVTRGEGPLVLDPRTATRPTLVVIARPLSLPDEAAYRRGIALVIVGAARSADGLLDATVKSANYLANIQALRIAAERGADDALLCAPSGTVTEGATSNLFCVVDGALVTPPLDGSLLPGITRGVVCRLARDLGLAVHERPLSPADVRGADEVFLTSSVRGIMAVRSVDGSPVAGRDGEGPVTRRLRGAYAARIEALAREGTRRGG